ncbi:FMN reductase [Nocardioides daedukensis]|uniref:FMN reductase n=1 Tax=Nocardioides daedukensis TaxID=634462 RepID=A0A7Y9RZK9_9ACTN|nr:FMN reductase [Nocardioides daedukensis]NYG57707.1 FMN reductase [Nocardioides daedukensis]
MTRIAVISGGLSSPSSTRLLADQLAAATVRSLADRGREAEVDVIELRPLAHDLADMMLTGFAPEALAGALDKVASADAVIAVSPVFSASFSGLFKMFFDAIDKDALEGTPVLIGATAGTARHSLVTEHALRPMFAYLKAVVVPTAVFAASEDFGSSEGGALSVRVAKAGSQLAAVVSGTVDTRSTRPVKVTIDNPEDTPDFESMLASLSG